MNYKRRKDCRLCHSNTLSLVLELEKSALANAFVSDTNIMQETFPLDLFQCHYCGHYQLLDVVDPSLLFSHYLYVSGTSEVMREHFKKYARSVVSEFDLSSNDLVVDIGSNDGSLLGCFKNLGTKVLGVDPAENIAKKATEEGIETLPTFFNQNVANDIVKKYGKVKVVCSNNCFAHIDDLDEIVLGIKILLKNDGIFIFEVSSFSEVIKCNDFSQIYSEHLSYHTIRPLHHFFNRHNMRICKTESVGIHGGSTRYFIVKEKDPDYNFNEIEYSFRKNEKELFSKFKTNIENNKQELKDKLLKLKSEGKSIAAVAASAKSTTFLHHYNIGSETIDYICDDAKEKVGLFSAGKHITIVPFSTIYEKKPNYLLILSLNFAKSIIKNNEDFVKKHNGKFIIPLPDYKIIDKNNIDEYLK